MRAAEALAVVGLVLAAPAAARGDGAFPAGEGVLVPADTPQEILLVTNFGVVSSEDGGATWTWSCEQDANALGTLYQRGPAPRRRLFAVANQRVIYSDDATCSWQTAGGLLTGQSVSDLFPDPTNADRVIAIGVADALSSVFESADGGATFGAMLYQASGGDIVTSVEIARSDPRVVYLALTDQDQHSKLARTSDAGAHWTVNDLSADLGAGLMRIIAVDPDDADTLLLRWSSATGGEAIAVTHDGGVTASKPLSIPHYFTSFTRMSDGALVMSAVVAVSPAVKAGLFVSRDGALSFQENDAVPGVVALAQRGGVLYAATDNFGDGYALGTSSDLGATWQPVVRFDQIGSIMECLQTNPQCQASCEALAGNGLGSPGQIWPEAVCTAGAATGGSGGSGGASGAGNRGGAGAGGSAAGTSAHGSSGGDCAVAPGPTRPSPVQAILAALLIGVALRRQRNQRRG
jgi:MYXO-CTERM domain-containing protein